MRVSTGESDYKIKTKLHSIAWSLNFETYRGRKYRRL